MMIRRYAIPLLGAVNLALAGTLAWLWLAPDGSLRNVKWQAPAPRKGDLASMLPPTPGMPAGDPAQYLAMLDRPLFSTTRRPPPPPPPPAPPPPVDTLASARVSGVFSGDGVGGVIISVDGKSRRVRLNESINGWTVKSIAPRSVTLTQGAQTRVLEMPRAALSTYTGLARQSVPGAVPAPQAPAARPPAVAAPSNAPRAVFGGTAR
jgi:hypothetical protein